MDRFEVFLLACGAVVMIMVLYCCVSIILTNNGEVITIHVENKYTCIENGDRVYKIVTDSGVYTTLPSSVNFNFVYSEIQPGKTYDVKLFNPVPPMYPEWKYGRLIKSIVNGPCISYG